MMRILQIRTNFIVGMVLVLIVAFVIFFSQFYGTDPNVRVNFLLKERITSESSINLEDTRIAEKLESATKKDIYAITFDAGSTGSRVHIFHFTVDRPGSPLKLIKETFEQVKPGLSSYEREPHNGALSLKSMLDQCLAVIPQQFHKVTPISVKATAGLRLLSEGAADNLLNEVKVFVKTYPFQLPDDGIGIMDGVDEGVFSWMTVNFMLGFLVKDVETVAALDLGGGSTQITFVPQQETTIREAPAGYIKNISLFHNKYSLYTHSFLGLGLMSARFTLIGGNDQKEGEEGPLSGPCIPPGHVGTWNFAGKDHKIVGASYDDFKYASCERQIKAVVRRQVQPLPELASQYIYIFSYFYDIALEADLIKEGGGTILLKYFHDEASKVFALPESHKDKAFKAFDLTYAYTLLRHGYGIPDETKLYLEKKINGVEVSWGLGAAFQLLSSVGQAR